MEIWIIRFGYDTYGYFLTREKAVRYYHEVFVAEWGSDYRSPDLDEVLEKVMAS